MTPRIRKQNSKKVCKVEEIDCRIYIVSGGRYCLYCQGRRAGRFHTFWIIRVDIQCGQGHPPVSRLAGQFVIFLTTKTISPSPYWIKILKIIPFFSFVMKYDLFPSGLKIKYSLMKSFKTIIIRNWKIIIFRS